MRIILKWLLLALLFWLWIVFALIIIGEIGMFCMYVIGKPFSMTGGY
jgi:hypothetical protein